MAETMFIFSSGFAPNCSSAFSAQDLNPAQIRSSRGIATIIITSLWPDVHADLPAFTKVVLLNIMSLVSTMKITSGRAAVSPPDSVAMVIAVATLPPEMRMNLSKLSQGLKDPWMV
jgi:hypothetical protein